jgi:hypothetical protein
MYTRPTLLATLLGLFLALCAVAPANAQCSGNSDCQVILSGTGLPATSSQCTP